MTAKGGGRNPGLRWRCRDCEQRWTVKHGTPFEGTRIPMAGVARGLGVTAAGVDRDLIPRLQREAHLAPATATEHRDSFIEVVFPEGDPTTTRSPRWAIAAAVAALVFAAGTWAALYDVGTTEAATAPVDRYRETWRSQGDLVIIETDRVPGESDGDLMARHREAIEAHKIVSPPD